MNIPKKARTIGNGSPLQYDFWTVEQRLSPDASFFSFGQRDDSPFRAVHPPAAKKSFFEKARTPPCTSYLCHAATSVSFNSG